MLKANGYLSPVILQVLGVILLVVFVAFWLVSGKESALLVGAALTLIGVGSASGAVATVRAAVQSAQDDLSKKKPDE